MFKKQYTFSDLFSSKNGILKFDFGILNKKNQLLFLIEFQGIQHFKDCGEFGKTQREETDILKQKYCEENNIPLIYINYDENIIQKIKNDKVIIKRRSLFKWS